MQAHELRVPLKIAEYNSNAWSNLPTTVTASGGGGALTVTGRHNREVDGQVVVVEIDSDGDGGLGASGATFAWKIAGNTQASNVATSSATSLGTTGLTLALPSTSNDSTHSWYFTPSRLDLEIASPSNADETHYAARILKCVAGSGGVVADMPGGSCALTMSEGEEILGEFKAITNISNTITNLRVSW